MIERIRPGYTAEPDVRETQELTQIAADMNLSGELTLGCRYEQLDFMPETAPGFSQLSRSGRDRAHPGLTFFTADTCPFCRWLMLSRDLACYRIRTRDLLLHHSRYP